PADDRPGHGVGAPRSRARPRAAARGVRARRRQDPIDDRGVRTMSRTVRVMQEDWGVFQNLHATAKRFTEQTGIDVEVTLTVIPEMWELMERSFSGEDPPFDLVGVDDLLLIQAARAGHVEPVDELIAADGYSLDDFPPAAIDALSDGGRIGGLPYCFVSNVLIYRADL